MTVSRLPVMSLRRSNIPVFKYDNENVYSHYKSWLTINNKVLI